MCILVCVCAAVHVCACVSMIVCACIHMFVSKSMYLTYLLVSARLLVCSLYSLSDAILYQDVSLLSS